MDPPAPKRCRSLLSDQEIESSNESAERESRESKTAPYRDRRYPMLLEFKGSFMRDSAAGMLAADRKTCRTLITFKQRPPSNTLFDSQYFLHTIHKLEGENETRVIRDIGQLITPSAECLATQGMQRLRFLKEGTNAGWTHSIPFQGPRPQPDFGVGFARDAFSPDQIQKLKFTLFNRTPYTATVKIYFPFFTSEVKCGQETLEIAERQNAHSMTVAVRGVIKLYQSVGRVTELNRRVLGFSVAHNHQQVRLFAHYAHVDEEPIKYYRHFLKDIFLLNDDGEARWAAYQFTRNIYNTFAPLHLQRIKSAIDQLPAPTIRSFASIQYSDDAAGPQEISRGNTPPAREAAFKQPAPSRRGSIADLKAQLEQQSQEAGRQRQQSEQFCEEIKQDRARLFEEVKQLREDAKQQREDAQREIKQQREDAQREKDHLQAQLTRLIDLLAQSSGKVTCAT